MQDGTGGDGNLIPAARTLVKPTAPDLVTLGGAAPRAGPAFVPALLEEKAGAVFFGGEAPLKLQY